MSFFSKFGSTSIVTQKYEVKTTKTNVPVKQRAASSSTQQVPRRVAPAAGRMVTSQTTTSTPAKPAQRATAQPNTLKRKLESAPSRADKLVHKRSTTESLKPPSPESVASYRGRSAASSRSPRSMRLESSDDESDDARHHLPPRCKTSTSPGAPVDRCRNVVHPLSFRTRDPTTNEPVKECMFVHADQIANLELKDWSRRQELRDSEMLMVGLNYPGVPQQERYMLVKHSDPDEFDPIGDMLATMKRVAADLLPADIADQIHSETSGGIVYRLGRALKHGDADQFLEHLMAYNTLVRTARKNGTFKKRIKAMDVLPFSLVEHILQQAYARTVALEVESLRDYQAFSSEVYGELLPKFTTKIFREVGLTSNQVFIDLGSGTGNVVLHAALEIGCESWGCEKMDKPAELAQRQREELLARCRMWGINPGKVRLEHDNFLDNRRIQEVMKRVDVLLVNNFAFPPDLNQRLLDMFLDLKEGARIISLRPFVPANHVITTRNAENPVNRLRIVEKQYFSREVSWTDSGGKYYVQTVDSSMLQEFKRREEQKNRRR